MAELPKDTIYHYESKDGMTMTITMTELVRCKRCKKHTDGNKESHEVFCEVYEVVKSENGYCDEAVRKDDTSTNSVDTPTEYTNRPTNESTIDQLKVDVSINKPTERWDTCGLSENDILADSGARGERRKNGKADS